MVYISLSLCVCWVACLCLAENSADLQLHGVEVRDVAFLCGNLTDKIKQSCLSAMFIVPLSAARRQAARS